MDIPFDVLDGVDRTRAVLTGWRDVVKRIRLAKAEAPGIKEAARRASKQARKKANRKAKRRELVEAGLLGSAEASSPSSEARASSDDADRWLDGPAPPSEEERERERRRRERAQISRAERKAAAEQAEAKAALAAARAPASPEKRPAPPASPRTAPTSTEGALVHSAYISPAERGARALAGAQKQREASEAAATRRAQRQAAGARMKEWQAGASQAEREQQLPAPLTLAAFRD